jgi:hypothetical protein
MLRRARDPGRLGPAERLYLGTPSLGGKEVIGPASTIVTDD